MNFLRTIQNNAYKKKYGKHPTVARLSCTYDVYALIIDVLEKEMALLVALK
jgi:hypothetical protein